MRQLEKHGRDWNPWLRGSTTVGKIISIFKVQRWRSVNIRTKGAMMALQNVQELPLRDQDVSRSM
jgi:hypothetical protein